MRPEQKQNSDFLGGGPKFNTVGKDNRPAPGMEEPAAAPKRTGDWMRVAGIALLVLMLAGVLFYLNDQDLGKTTHPVARGGETISPEAKPAPTGADR